MRFESAGEPAHTRCLSIELSQGEPGSVEFRADILDLRKAGLMQLAGRVAGAGIIHRMEVTGAFASDTATITRIEWQQSHVMHEANRVTKGECCRDPMGRLAGLVGVRLGEGFVADLKQRFGGPLGCTHVNTLLQELSAVVANLLRSEDEADPLGVEREAGERIASRSLFLDAVFPEGNEAAALNVRLADLVFRPLNPDGSESLFAHDELRLLADVKIAGWELLGLEAGERQRRGPTFEAQAWRPIPGLAEFVGRSLGGGMAKFCLERFGGQPEHARLLSVLLSLGPGMTQVGAALAETLAPSPASRPRASGMPGPGPCYMLRAEGPLMEVLFGASDE